MVQAGVGQRLALRLFYLVTGRAGHARCSLKVPTHGYRENKYDFACSCFQVHQRMAAGKSWQVRATRRSEVKTASEGSNAAKTNNLMPDTQPCPISLNLTSAAICLIEPVHNTQRDRPRVGTDRIGKDAVFRAAQQKVAARRHG